MLKQKKRKTKPIFTERYAYSTILFIVSTISALSISWKSFELLNVLNKPWALPVIAIFTGVLTFLLPALVYRYSIFCIIYETGWTILIVQLIEAILPAHNTAIIAVITGGIVYIMGDFISLFLDDIDFYILNIIRHLVISFILSALLIKLKDSIFIIFVLLGAYALKMISCKIRLPLDNKIDYYMAKLKEFISTEPETK